MLLFRQSDSVCETRLCVTSSAVWQLVISGRLRGHEGDSRVFLLELMFKCFGSDRHKRSDSD